MHFDNAGSQRSSCIGAQGQPSEILIQNAWDWDPVNPSLCQQVSECPPPPTVNAAVPTSDVSNNVQACGPAQHARIQRLSDLGPAPLRASAAAIRWLAKGYALAAIELWAAARMLLLVLPLFFHASDSPRGAEA
jgi:hypothetical protein